MSVELPRDAEGREIPLDTVALFGGNGNVYNIVRWIYTTDFETWSESNTWRAIAENHRALDPELMCLTPPGSWEKLEEDLSRGADAEYCAPCYYVFRGKSQCKECRFLATEDESCSRQAFAEILERIRKLRGED